MKKTLLIIATLFLFLFINVYAEEEEQFIEVTISKCISGDTVNIKLKDGNILPIKLLGIDIPINYSLSKEDHTSSVETDKYICEKLTKANLITIEYDENNKEVDSNGRTPVWVFVDGKLLQEDLVKYGYAKVDTLHDDYKYIELLKEKEEIAKTRLIGVWNVQEDSIELVEEKKEEEKQSKGLFNKILKAISDFFSNIFKTISNFIHSIIEKQ